MFKNPTQGALYMFDMGAKVFPLKPNEKKPAFVGWQEYANKINRKTIEEFGRANPRHNWGVYCGSSNFLVVDLDEKDGRDGIKHYEELGYDTNTFTVITPSGGKHLYYVGKGPCTQSAAAKGVDTRGRGGYVVCPGSKIDQRQYEIELDKGFIPLPENLLEKLEEEKRPQTLKEDQIIESGTQHSTLVSLAGTMRARGMGFDAINAALQSLNESQSDEPCNPAHIEQIAKGVCKYEPSLAEAAASFIDFKPQRAKTADQIDMGNIPKRDWVMHGRYIGKFISVIVSPGGTGKSSLTMLDALAVASGKNLTGFEIKKQGPVWMYNTEDPSDELERRFSALSIQHEIPLSDMKDIHFTSSRDNPLILAKEVKGQIAINNKAIDSTIAYIREHKIVLFIVDPFVRTHEMNENDNMQIDKVIWCFQKISNATGCSVCLVHHTNKSGLNSKGERDMDKARGASAFINASRIAHVVSSMTEKEADGLGIEKDERFWYMRLDNAKANLHAPLRSITWFKKASVDLPNGDNVGALFLNDLTSTIVKRKEEVETASMLDVGHILHQNIKIGETLGLKKLYEEITVDPKYAHILEGGKSQGFDLFKRILKKGLTYKEKAFIFKDDAGTKPRYSVSCISAKVDFLA